MPHYLDCFPELDEEKNNKGFMKNTSKIKYSLFNTMDFINRHTPRLNRQLLNYLDNFYMKNEKIYFAIIFTGKKIYSIDKIESSYALLNYDINQELSKIIIKCKIEDLMNDEDIVKLKVKVFF